jgi:hypothetical protein
VLLDCRAAFDVIFGFLAFGSVLRAWYVAMAVFSDTRALIDGP